MNAEAAERLADVAEIERLPAAPVERARVSYFLSGAWLWECGRSTCPAVEFAASAGAAGDEARAHMARHCPSSH